MEIIQELLRQENYTNEKVIKYAKKYYNIIVSSSIDREESNSKIALLVTLKKQQRHLVYKEFKNNVNVFDSFIFNEYKNDTSYEKQKVEIKEGEFQCKKCHNKKCTYFLLQTRAADEGFTTFITCINCGDRWKQN
jgi:DNA-directed RNA polymerase subunit M/transcription elongation factor TFIIS